MGAKIWYDGIDLNKFGPTPFINLSKTTNRDSANVHILSETINITLEGKITAYKKGVSEQAHKPGLDRLLEDEKQLRHLFSRDGLLTVTCSANNSQALANGVSNGKFGFWWDDTIQTPNGLGKGFMCKVMSYNISKTEDNWVQTIDYTVELQCNHSKNATLPHAHSYTISSYTDEWTIEPVEDAAYYHLNVLNNNPNATVQDWPAGLNKLDNLIQFRITHRVGAQGLSAPTGQYNAGEAAGLSRNFNDSAWYNAKRFVEEHIKMPHNNINHVFLAYNNNGFGQHSYVNENNATGSKTQNEEIYLYNHVRATNVSESNGTFDITDTWLALSKPTHYLEDYSVEVTQDNNFNVTVRINGTVQGLEIKKAGYTEGSALKQTTTHNAYNSLPPAGVGLDRGKLDLQNINEGAIYSAKYNNALEAWRNFVEPLLYARSNSLAMYMVQGQTTKINATNNTLDNTNGELNRSVWGGVIPQVSDGGNFQIRYPQTNFGTCDYLDKRENIILDTRFVNKTIGSDPTRGTITYSCEFNNRRGANQIKGATILSLNVQDSKPADVIAEMFVMGRKRGPILQDTGSKTAKTRQVSIEIQTTIPRNMGEFDTRYNACPMWTGGIVYKDLLNIIDMLRPVLPDTWIPTKLADLRSKDPSITLINGSYAGQVYIKSDDETWNPIEGRFSKTITWVYDA
jgi:hypothetical protein